MTGHFSGLEAILILDYLSADRILLDGRARRKDDVLVDLARLLASGDEPLRALILEGLFEREAVMSTGIGHGIALPHARLDGLPGLRLALVRYRQGVDFQALDGRPVHLAFGVIGPPAEADGHVKALARIARLVKQGSAVPELLVATDVDVAIDILRRHDPGR